MAEDLFQNLELENDNETVLQQPTILSSIKDAISNMVNSKIRAMLLAAFSLMTAPSYSDSLTKYADGFSIPTELVYCVEESQSELKDNLHKRIETLASISDQNADGRAHRLTDTVKRYADMVVDAASDEYLLGWTFFPDINGALRMDFKQKDVVSCISIGDDGFSWFAQSNNSFDMKDRGELSVEDITLCMKNVIGLIGS